jgi:DivIVA domain-containing protein
VVTWFFAVLVVLAMGGVAVVASGRGGSLPEAYDDRPDVRVPATGPLTGDDVRGVRFSLGLRGYRMSEVDALLERLAVQLDERPGNGHGGGPGGGSGPGPGPGPEAGPGRSAARGDGDPT